MGLEVNRQENQGSAIAEKLIDAANAPVAFTKWPTALRAIGTVQLRLA